MARPEVDRERVERGITKIIRRYPDGREVVKFQIRYSDSNGKIISDSTFTTAAKARAALARERTRVIDGEHVDPTLANTTFLKVAEDWLASNPHWKERTRRANEWTVRTKLVPLHDKRMKQLTQKKVLKFRRGMQNTVTSRGTPPAPSSVKRTMNVLYSICEHACVEGHLVANPCLRLKKIETRSRDFNVPSVKQIDRLVRRLAAPTPERVDALGRTLRERPADPRWALLVEVAAWTGMRAGELAGLKKSDLDFDLNTIDVRRTIIDTKGGLREDTPKSKASRRTIHLTPEVAKKLRKFTKRMRQGDYVFGSTRDDGTRLPLRHNQFQGRVFRPVVEELGLDITFHDLRHFHASLLIADAWTPLEVAERLGHERPSFTLDRYTHLFRAHRPNAGARVAEAVARARGEQVKPARPSGKKPF